MSKLDERRTQKLDEQFEDILNQVKPYLLNLPAPYKSRCRLWLERFDRAEDQRNLRNEYLLELYNQLKIGYLKAPFNKPPDNGRLVSLFKFNRLGTSSSCNELTETSPSIGDPHRNWPKPKSKSLRRDITYRSKPSAKQKEEHSSSPRGDVLSSPTVQFREQNNRCEKSLLRTYKKRIETLSTIVEELENQNEKLKQKLIHYHNISTPDEIPNLRLRIKQLMSEIKNLKSKLTEVHELKAVLEKHHKEIVDQYKIKTTEHFKKMKHQLENARIENEDLNNKIILVESKIQELSQEKKESAKVYEEKWLHKLEQIKLEYNKLLEEKKQEIKSRDEIVHQKEIQLSQKLDEIDSLCEQIKKLQQLVEMKTEDDGKLQCILMKQHKSIMGELSKMKNNIEVASRQQTESHQQEIALLKKNVIEFEKITHKIQEEYGKKLYQFIQEQYLNINNLRTRLKNVLKNPLRMALLEKSCANYTIFENNSKKLLNLFKFVADDHCCKYFQKLSILEDQISQLENR